MANGQAIITFDGVDLDNCIKQGLEVTGYAKCPNCKQIYTFQINLNLQEKLQKYIEAEIDGKTVTTRVPDNYNVSIKFAKASEPIQTLDLFEDEGSNKKEKCDPCSGCTPGCDRL